MKEQSYNKILSQALVTWLLFIPIVICNGVIREVVYKPFIGELAAHQISTFIAFIAYLLLAYFRLKYYVAGVAAGKLFIIGLMWVVLTIVFKFGIGHFITGTS